MKQVIFAIALLAMASLTGCLTDDESSVDETTDTTSDNTGNTNDNSNDNTDSGDDGMIDPVGSNGGHTPPENSDVRVDWGYSGHWIETSPDSNYFEWIACSKQGYSIKIGDRTLYCDLDERQDLGAQTWVNKTGNTVTIECIRHIEGDDRYACKNSYANNNDFVQVGAHIVFTSVEGFQERVYVTLSETSRTSSSNSSYGYDFNHKFFKTEVKLQFEPVSFTISEHMQNSQSSTYSLDDGTVFAFINGGTVISQINNAFSSTYSSTRYF